VTGATSCGLQVAMHSQLPHFLVVVVVIIMYCIVHVHRLPYVEATILELLRYKTVVPLGITHSTLNDTEVGGYFIPRGTTVS